MVKYSLGLQEIPWAHPQDFFRAQAIFYRISLLSSYTEQNEKNCALKIIL